FALVGGAALGVGKAPRPAWTTPAGLALAAAAASAGGGLAAGGPDWPEQFVPIAAEALAAFALVAALIYPAAKIDRPEPRRMFIGAVATAAGLGLPQLAAVFGRALLPEVPTAAPLSVLAAWVPALAAASLVAIRRPRAFRAAAYWAAPWLAATALAGLFSAGGTPEAASFALLALEAAALAAAALWVPGRLAAHPRPRRAARVTLVSSALLLLLPLTTHTAGERPLIAAAGLVAPAVILVVGRAIGPWSWPWLVAVAYSYFLIDLSVCLPWALDPPLDRLGALGLVAGLVVVAATWSPRPKLPTWGVIAGLSALALAPSAASLLLERGWWGAAAMAAATAAAASATVSRRRPLPRSIRVVGAGLAVFAAALTAVPVLALVTPGSASVWLFPLIAIEAALAAQAGAALRARSDRPGAPAIGAALLASGAVLGLAAVGLSVTWPVTEAQTVFATAVILAAGAAAAATMPGGLRSAWWYMGTMSCVGLWSALVWGDVGVVEAYTLPPAVAATLVGGILSRNRPRYQGLIGAGLGLGIVPVLFLLGQPEAQLARTVELGAMALLALVCSSVFDHLRRPLAAAGAVAGLGPLIAGLMVGRLPSFPKGAWNRPPWPWFAELEPLSPYQSVLFGIACLLGLVAAACWAVAAWQLSADSRGPRAARWWAMPALVAAALTPVCSMRFTWLVVAAMWLAMAACLALTVVAARLEAKDRLLLPPYWAVWLVALALGIAGWSTRQLRVECFALPLGLALFAAGLVVAGKVARYGAPGWAVAPGVAATLGPSTLAVGTDPQTWRAIGVLVLALAFMLAAVRFHWKPPVFVCAGSMVVSLGLALARHGNIHTLPWLAALIVVGGTLLAISLVSERRSKPSRQT
ncbi:MAG: hypothetical protein LBD90_07320, partial [Bifidobacteriaceae bacterium]|nr:hypothetical protein [Bifidobacteriaceae bacterium]